MQISAEKGIPKEEIIATVASAIAAAYKKEYCDKDEKVEAAFEEKRSNFFIYEKKLVVSEKLLKNPEEAKEISFQEVKNLDTSQPLQLEKGDPKKLPSEEGLDEEDTEQSLIKFKPQRHILLAEAKKLIKNASAGDWILFPLIEKEGYGRIAAQTAKQVITQRLRELERLLVFENIKEREGQILPGIIQRIDREVVYIDLGKVTGTLVGPDRISQEYYRPGQRLKVLLSEVEQGMRGPVVFLSRSSAKALARMFRDEVPEIASAIVEIKAVAREAGSRSKIAVLSHSPDVDPIGSCVGQKGTRIAVIINEFGGEKIDIILYSDDPALFIAQALSPAKTLQVVIDDEKNRRATAYVSEDQQSLAIGKKGQNVRLAAKLTGWKIDVRLPGETREENIETKERNSTSDKPSTD